MWVSMPHCCRPGTLAMACCDITRSMPCWKMKKKTLFKTFNVSILCHLQVPRRAPVVQANEEVYWQRMSAGIGADMPALDAGAAPWLWSYRQCAEVDGRFFYSGARRCGSVLRRVGACCAVWERAAQCGSVLHCGAQPPVCCRCLCWCACGVGMHHGW